MREYHLWLATAMASSGLASNAHASNFGVGTGQTFVQAVPGNPVLAGNGITDDNFTHPAAPLTTQYSTTGSANGGASATVTQQTKAFYGDLSYSGSGSCNPGLGVGCGTVFKTNLKFMDELTPQGALPRFTPVTLAVTFRYEDAFTQTSSFQPTRSGTSLYMLGRILAQTYVTRLRDFSNDSQPGAQTFGFTDTVQFTALIGSPFQVIGNIYTYSSAESYIWPSGNYTSSASARLRMTITPLTAGVSFTSASGASYGAGVPEPANWVFLLAGFGLLGTQARRRQRRRLAA